MWQCEEHMRAIQRGLAVKTILIGEGGVGKTSLAVRYTEDRFDERMKMTIGANFLSKRVTVDGREITLVIWDLGGQPRFQDVVTSYFSGASLAIAVYEVPSPYTLARLENWILRLREQAPECDLFIVGNKIDEYRPGQGVTLQEAEEFAKRYNARLFQVSAKTGQNVAELFYEVARFLVKKHAR